MHAHVNSNCIGCGLCPNLCPEIFTMTDEGVAVAKSEVGTQAEDAAREAADSCPVNAIELS
ncbi:MAG: ferredoxin [Oscillospiraceae bacterium]|nr:ferredoxin [Oscillospiraceae bacterium]